MESVELDTAPETALQRQRWVNFRLGAQAFGLDVLTVQEVLCLPALAPVPGAPPECLGVINLRGRIIPVIDLRQLLARPYGEDAETTRLVVVDDGDEAVALKVDQVGEVLDLPASTIEAAPDVGNSLCPDQLHGVHRRGDRLLLLLDTAAVLRTASSRIAGVGR